MSKYYITHLNSTSGIAHYSRDFYDMVLKDQGYIYLDSADGAAILQRVKKTDQVYLEIGLSQQKEVELLFRMLDAGFDQVSVTLHDPPLIRYPYFQFRNKLLNIGAKVLHVYFNNLGIGHHYYRRIRHIVVLNKRAQGILEKKFGLDNVRAVPMIVDPSHLDAANFQGPASPDNFIFFGFIDKRKGLDYALALHERYLAINPASTFTVIGKPGGAKAQRYLDALKARYTKNVAYLGFVEAETLNKAFADAAFVMLPFEEYGFLYPTSASILNALKRGKIVFTTPVNTLAEFITHGETGYFLKRDLDADLALLQSVINDPAQSQAIKENIYKRMSTVHAPAYIKAALQGII